MEPSPQFAAQWIAAMLLGKPQIQKKPVKVDDETLKSYVGIYKIAEGDYREVFKEGEKLFTQRTGSTKLRIYPDSQYTFYYKMSFSKLRFVKDNEGKVVKMVMVRPSGEEEAIRIDKKEKKQKGISPFAEYQGTFGEKDGFKVEIFESEGKLMGQGSGQSAFELIAEGKDIFTNKTVGVKIEFRRDRRGKIIGFYLYQRGMKMVMDKN